MLNGRQPALWLSTFSYGMSRAFPADIAALFGASQDISLFVWEHSPGWPVIHCTSNVSDLIGYSKQAFESRQVTFMDTLHPDDKQRVADEVMNGIKNPNSTSFTHEDYRLLHRNGDSIWVADTTIIERDAAGKILYLVGYMQNISARKNLELALLAERRHLQMVLEGTRLGSWDWNPQTNSLQVNQRWLSMYGHELSTDVVNMAFWESLIHPDDRQGWHRALQMHLFADSPYYEHVYRMRHARGHYLYVLDRGKVVEWNEQHKAVRFAGTHTDISKQKQAELEARQAARSRTVFMANMSHEIRTPLHGILGLASVLANTELNHQQRELLRTMQESGAYLLNTLNDAIDMSRAEEGKLRVEIGVHSTASLLAHLRTLFCEQAQQSDIDYQVQASEYVPEYMLLDKSRLLQIAVNLVSNAFKFTKTGFVHVALNWRQDTLTLKVTDSGIGIADTKKVWDVFEQEHPGLNFAKHGGGLGLGIVKSLVNLMGGHVHLTSRPRQGSEFTVSLPVKAGHSPAQSELPALPKRQVLIIDDNDVNQLILGQMLSKLEQRHVATSSAREGLELLQQQRFDVVFMDIHMPDLDGVEATRRIREQSSTQPYIIGLTANALTNMREQALSAGMDAYLTKPFQYEDIRDALYQIVS